jgi:GntR family transcriptional regulator
VPPASIELRSPVPYYFQLATLIAREIRSGRWLPGGRIAGEAELCDALGVSRTTIREALSRLEQEGLIRRERGRGSFVAEARPRSWLLQSSFGFAQDEVERLGRKVTSQVLAARVEPLPEWASDLLDLPAGSGGVTLERLRAVDGMTALYVVNHLPSKYAPTVLALSDPEASLYAALWRDANVEVAGGKRVVEAVEAGDKMAQLLEVDPRSPLLVVESVSWDHDRQPFDCYRAWVRSDRMKIDVEVNSTREPQGVALATAFATGTATAPLTS